ncbi:MAG: DUF4446 family protein [Bilifractor sp.]|jgi:transposase
MQKIIDTFGSTMGTLFIVMVIAVIVLLFLTISLIVRQNRLSYRMKVFMRGKNGKSLERELEERMKELEKVNGRQGINQADMSMIRRRMTKVLTHYGIVKYDAFDDVGGKLSFVLAMLDDDNTGFVLDAIHSKDNCFVYLKEIVNGESYIMLSDEEMTALKQAAGTEDQEG